MKPYDLKPYNYKKDTYGQICLAMAVKCNTDVGFGAVFVKNNEVQGIGRNRRATDRDRKLIPHTDYAIHAEQDAILNALDSGYSIEDGEIYVLGKCLSGKNKGMLTTRTERIFVCRKCPHVFLKYNISVNIPYITGWMNIPARESLEIGSKVAQRGYWGSFVSA